MGADMSQKKGMSKIAHPPWVGVLIEMWLVRGFVPI